MRQFGLFICVFASGCISTQAAFVKTDPAFVARHAQTPPIMLFDLSEAMQAPAFRTVGIIEATGAEGDSIKHFLTAIREKATDVGCDLLVQREIYRQRANGVGPRGRSGSNFRWYDNGQASWQFACGVLSADSSEALTREEDAARVALELRTSERGETHCLMEAPIGSHVARPVCR